MSDLRAVLEQMNRSELVQLARNAGLGNLPRTDRGELIEALECDEPREVDGLQQRRIEMQAHIKKHRARLLSQLPGCSGLCTTHGCPDLIVMRCWAGFSRDML